MIDGAARLRALPRPHRRRHRLPLGQTREPVSVRHARGRVAGRTRPSLRIPPSRQSGGPLGGLSAQTRRNHGVPSLRDLAWAPRSIPGAEDGRSAPCRVMRPVGSRPLGKCTPAVAVCLHGPESAGASWGCITSLVEPMEALVAPGAVACFARGFFHAPALEESECAPAWLYELSNSVLDLAPTHDLP